MAQSTSSQGENVASEGATGAREEDQGEEDDGGHWEDITETCVLASAAMGVGEMVCESGFSLAEAMSALELMDPKMDDGMMEPVEGVNSRLERGVLKVDDLTAAEALAVIQGLVSHEVAYYEGGTLGESVFTCLYLHAPALHHLMQRNKIRRLNGQLVQEEEQGEESKPAYALMAFILGMFKTISLFRKVVLKADIYEEEDCVPNSFGLYMGENLTDDDVMYLLTKAEQKLKLQEASAPSSGTAIEPASSASSGSSSSSHSAVVEDTVPPPPPPPPAVGKAAAAGAAGQEGGGGAMSVCEMLRRAVRSRRLLVSALQEVSAFKAAEWDTTVPLLRSSLLRAKTELASLVAAASPGDPAAISEAVSFAFDPAVLRASKGNAPRRQVVALPFAQAASHLVTMVADLYDALDLFLRCDNLQQVRVFLERLSRRAPNVLINSFLHIHFQHEDRLLGRLPIGPLLVEHMTAFGVPASVSSSVQGVEFIEASWVTVIESLKLFLHNRSRQRVRLEVLFHDLAVMQENAALLDDHFREVHSLPESSNRHLLQWAMDETLRAMQHYITLGFELELYMDEEVDGVLWYLDCLLTYRVNVIGHMQSLKRDMEIMRQRMEAEEAEEQLMLQQQQQQQEGQKGGGSSSSSSRKKKKGKDKGGLSSSSSSSSSGKKKPSSSGLEITLPDDADCREDTIEMNVMRLLCKGSHNFITAIIRAQGMARPPDPSFCSWEERFFNRFKAFLPLRHPMLLTYQDFFRNTSGSARDAAHFLAHARECFKSVKPFIDHGMLVHHDSDINKQSLRELARVAVSGSVGLAQAVARLEGGEQHKKLVIRTSLSAHKQVPVIAVEVRD